MTGTDSSEKDEVTGLINAQYLRVRLDAEINEPGNGRPACVVVEVEKFDSWVDRYGPSMGDAVLKKTATLLVGGVKRTDIVGRLEGPRFLVVLFNTPEDIASIVMNRIRASVGSMAFELGDVRETVTSRLGMVSGTANVPWKFIRS